MLKNRRSCAYCSEAYILLFWFYIVYTLDIIFIFHLQDNCILILDLRKGWQELGAVGGGVSGSLRTEALFAYNSTFQGSPAAGACDCLVSSS